MLGEPPRYVNVCMVGVVSHNCTSFKLEGLLSVSHQTDAACLFLDKLPARLWKHSI